MWSNLIVKKNIGTSPLGPALDGIKTFNTWIEYLYPVKE